MPLPAKKNPLEAYDPSQFNVLTPMLVLDGDSPLHQTRTQVVRINPDPAAGEVFPMQGGKLYLSAAARRKLAAVAGIVENWRESGFIVDTATRVTYQAIGAIQDASGQWRTVTASKTLDLEQIRKAKGYTEDRVQNIWQYRYERAETGAWSRLATAALALKSSYTAAELQRPFVVPRVILAIDYSDPEVRRMITARALDAQANVFGPAAGAPSALGASSVPRALGPAVNLDEKAGSDSGLPEDDPFDSPQAPAGASDDLPDFAADETAPVAPPTPQPQGAQRGQDDKGPYLICEEPGCNKKLRPAAGQSLDQAEANLRQQFGGVKCSGHRGQPAQGGLYANG